LARSYNLKKPYALLIIATKLKPLRNSILSSDSNTNYQIFQYHQADTKPEDIIMKNASLKYSLRVSLK